MADIRIKDLATTASSTASDDFLAVDGSANGTRKLNASSPSFGGNLTVAGGTVTGGSSGLTFASGGTNQNITLTPSGTGIVTSAANITGADFIVGSSGPSVKSSLSARAPRQGQVSDGTAGTTVANVAVIGTSDFTYAAWIYQPTAANADIISGAYNVPGLYVTSTGIIGMNDVGVAGLIASSAGAYTAGKEALIAYTRSGTTATIYVNGVSVASGTDSRNYASATTSIGSRNGSQVFSGFISPLIYNRALSASEVVALYEAGAPAGADYNSASNTALNTTTFSNSSVVPFTTFSGASATGFTASQTSVANARANMTGSTFNTQVGQQFILYYDLTLNSGTAPVAYLGIENVIQTANSVQLTAGTGKSVTLTAVSATSGAYLQIGVFNNASTTNFAISNVKLVRAGLLLAPDAAQAGGGYVWNDQSGNLAQIVLPSSGVQWNLPSVATNRIRGTTSTNGNQQLLGASVLLPAECQITHVRARARSGTPTITIGTASGGAQIVASVALSTTWLNCTIALTGGIVSSADDIWVGSNSTDVVETDIAFQPLDF